MFICEISDDIGAYQRNNIEVSVFLEDTLSEISGDIPSQAFHELIHCTLAHIMSTVKYCLGETRS